MYRTALNFRVSGFRHNVVVWLMLAILTWSFVPSVGFAQQPIATITELTGTMLLNGQEQGIGTVLGEGDVIETQADTTVVLELSDGSLLELGENTKLDLTVLSTTSTGARASHVKLAWGRLRAKLSAGHQQEGAFFDIETPNALLGVKFSQPDVEVSYDLEKQETVALALMVAIAAKNLLTDEEKIIPIGSIAVITALGIKIAAGAAAVGVIGAETATSEAVAGTAAAGMSKGTMIAIGAGALAAAGGAVALAGGGDDGDGSFTADPVGVWRVSRSWNFGLKAERRGQCLLSNESATFDIRKDGSWFFSDFNTSSLEGWWKMPGDKQIKLGDNTNVTVWEGTFTSSNTIEGTMQELMGTFSGTWRATR